MEAAGWKVGRTPDPLRTPLGLREVNNSTDRHLPEYQTEAKAIGLDGPGPVCPVCHSPHPETNRLEDKQHRMRLFKTGVGVSRLNFKTQTNQWPAGHLTSHRVRIGNRNGTVGTFGPGSQGLIPRMAYFIRFQRRKGETKDRATGVDDCTFDFDFCTSSWTKLTPLQQPLTS